MNAEGAARVNLLGMELDPLDEAEAVEVIAGGASGGLVLTPNLDHLRRFRDDGRVRSGYARARLVLPDGMPLVWASRIQGTPLPGRVAGSDLIWSVCAAMADEGRSVFLVGGAPGSAEKASAALSERFPGLRIAGRMVPEPGFERDEAQIEAVIAAIADARPALVLVGLPLDKQLLIGERLDWRAIESWVLGVGVAFSFVAGDLRRATPLAQKLGLEWVNRLIQEPRRLGRRYLIEGIPLGLKLFATALLARRRRVRR